MWRSIDGTWHVVAVPADASDPTSGQRYRVTCEGHVVAEVSTFAKLAGLVPLHLLVEHDDQH